MDTMTLYNGVRYAGIWILIYLIVSLGFHVDDVDSMIIAGIITILFIVSERMLVFKRKSDMIVANSVENFKKMEMLNVNNNPKTIDKIKSEPMPLVEGMSNGESQIKVEVKPQVEKVESKCNMKDVNGDGKIIEINGKRYVSMDGPNDESKNESMQENTNGDVQIQVIRSGMNGKLNTNPDIAKPYDNQTGKNNLDVDIRNVMSDHNKYENIHIMIDPFTKSNHTNGQCNTTNAKPDNRRKWYEQDFNPRDYQGAENLDQIKTRNGTRDDMLVNNFRYSDFNRMPPSFNQNDFEYGYSFIPPKDWYPLPPYPPVCVSSTTCEAQPVYTDDTTMNLKRWHETQKFTQPDSINTEYIKNELNSY